jgi:hypothetical protein
MERRAWFRLLLNSAFGMVMFGKARNQYVEVSMVTPYGKDMTKAFSSIRVLLQTVIAYVKR